MFIEAVWRRFGIKPRLITPSDLRLYPDSQSKCGYRLCCNIPSKASTVNHFPSNAWTFTAENGETWEEVYQVGLELHQRELVALDPELLRQIGLRCFNDLRTILLVHDKRMLGIVKQEIPQLLARSIITPAQAITLARGIVDTILPGSQELRDLSDASPDLRNEYIMKPIRSGKGDGIVFGDDLSPKEWSSALEGLRSADLASGGTCVVQRRVFPVLYDLVLRASVGAVKYPLVGTYHVANGELLGLGTWRASGGRIVAVSSGGSWICSVLAQE